MQKHRQAILLRQTNLCAVTVDLLLAQRLGFQLVQKKIQPDFTHSQQLRVVLILLQRRCQCIHGVSASLRHI